MEIPLDQLSEQALRGVIEEFITREGTDYGLQECSLEQKVAQVRRQLARREAILYFDSYLETCTILSADDASALLHTDRGL